MQFFLIIIAWFVQRNTCTIHKLLSIFWNEISYNMKQTITPFLLPNPRQNTTQHMQKNTHIHTTTMRSLSPTLTTTMSGDKLDKEETK